MNFAVSYSRASVGMLAPLVSIETHISKSAEHSFSIVGLAKTAVKESRDRVRAAIISCGFDYPYERIIVNLAPADLPKEGSGFDLAIALSILAASGQITEIPNDHIFLGELALSGAIGSVPGILPAAIACKKADHLLFLPEQNLEEVLLVQDLQTYPAKHLLQVCAHLNKRSLIQPCVSQAQLETKQYLHGLNEVKGQDHAKRALVIAAAGAHNLLMSGPPGTGKSMLATRLPSLLPELSQDEALELASIKSLKGIKTNSQEFYQRPFRAPHHTASAVALVGGGSRALPGEISLAHSGVLFMDELPEFDRKVLEVLREPIETGKINIARAQHQVCYPAEFQLIAAMNPCPCGYLGSKKKSCRCSRQHIQRYQAKLSGPFLDRMDLFVELHDLPDELLLKAVKSNENSQHLRDLVIQTRQRQYERQGRLNRYLEGKDLEQYCALDLSLQSWLRQAFTQLQLSARAYHRTLKVARTIADLAESEAIEMLHLTEALGLRK